MTGQNQKQGNQSKGAPDVGTEHKEKFAKSMIPKPRTGRPIRHQTRSVTQNIFRVSQSPQSTSDSQQGSPPPQTDGHQVSIPSRPSSTPQMNIFSNMDTNTNPAQNINPTSANLYVTAHTLTMSDGTHQHSADQRVSTHTSKSVLTRQRGTLAWYDTFSCFARTGQRISPSPRSKSQSRTQGISSLGHVTDPQTT